MGLIKEEDYKFVDGKSTFVVLIEVSGLPYGETIRKDIRYNP